MELSVPFSLPSLSPEWGPFHRRRIFMEIEKIERRLDDICSNKKNFKFGKDDGRRHEVPNERIQSFQQGPSHDPAQIVGRETELNGIAEVLTADLTLRDVSAPMRTVPVVVVHGAAGVGKTALAQLVYCDSRVVSYFDFKVWVDITDASDVTNVTKEIYEKMTRQRSDHGSLNTIQDLLRLEITSITLFHFLYLATNYHPLPSVFYF
jgi:NB-ARC domain